MIADKHVKKIINKQFKICDINLQYEDVLNNKIPNWVQKYTCTEEQNEKWIKWTKKYFKEKLHFNKEKCIVEAAWFNLTFGLKLNNKTIS